MNEASATSRTALLAGATGLVGHALLPLLLADKHYRRVHVLLRRATPHIEASRKVAGSQAAFRRVDFDFVVNTAQAARAAGATRLAVVSALGADAKSAKSGIHVLKSGAMQRD